LPAHFSGISITFDAIAEAATRTSPVAFLCASCNLRKAASGWTGMPDSTNDTSWFFVSSSYDAMTWVM